MNTANLLPTQTCPRCGTQLVRVERPPIQQFFRRLTRKTQSRTHALLCPRCQYTRETPEPTILDRIVPPQS